MKLQPEVVEPLTFPMTRFPEGSASKLVQSEIDRIVTVDENEIAKAIFTLSELENISVEGPAALGIAALASGELEFLKGERVVAILSGGNIDVKTISRRSGNWPKNNWHKQTTGITENWNNG